MSALSKRRQILILDLAERIARQPFRISDYQTDDAVGRPVENLLLNGYLFMYWVDHASREVRIIEILAV